MKTLTDYLKERVIAEGHEEEYIEHYMQDTLPNIKLLPLGPRIQKFIDKYDFKPVLGSDIERAIAYTKYFPARNGAIISAWDYYKELKDGHYLMLVLDGPGYRPTKLTAGYVLNEWKKGPKSEWLLFKCYGNDGNLKSPNELEEIITKNKLDKKF